MNYSGYCESKNTFINNLQFCTDVLTLIESFSMFNNKFKKLPVTTQDVQQLKYDERILYSQVV